MATSSQSSPPRKHGLNEKTEEREMNAINREIIEDRSFIRVDYLREKLEYYKEKFQEFDKDSEGNIDIFSMARMFEKKGQPTTHLEIKKIIREVDKSGKGAICYRDYITMMINPETSSALKSFEEYEQRESERQKAEDDGYDYFGLARMFEKMGQTKTHMELRKIIREPAKTQKGAICYKDLVTLMNRPEPSFVPKLTFAFEKKLGKRPGGPSPKRDFSDRP